MLGNGPIDVAIDRERVKRGGLSAFSKIAWELVEPATPLLWNWHLDLLCAHLEAVTRGEIRNLGVNVPPGTMKSTLVSVLWPAWEAQEMRGASAWLFASYDDSLSRRDSNKTKALMQSDWYVARWGDRVQVSREDTHSDSATEWHTNNGGWRFSTSVKGKMTGRHGDYLVIDDPHKPKDTTPVELEATKTWAKETASSRRRNPATFRRVLIMQRLHEEDLSGVYQTDKSGDWVWVILPMEFDPDTRCETKWGRDPRTAEGELLWPERYGPKQVAELKGPNGVGGTAYAAQYGQRPTPKGGAIFKRSWFSKRWTTLPSQLYLLQSWDMRFKEESDSGDWVVGDVWAQHGADFYLVDWIRERLSFTESVQAMLDLSKKHPKAFLKLIENKANGPAVANTLKRKVPGIVLVEPDGGKIARARAASVPMESGNVYFPNDPRMEDRIREHLMFPKGKHDDMVDAGSQALLRLLTRSGGGNYLEGLKKMAETLAHE